MPYILSPTIQIDTPALWNEGSIYEREAIYQIKDNKLPPVNYDKHSFKPHSLTHLETPAHTQNHGKRLEYYISKHPELFYGACSVIKLGGNRFISQENGTRVWEIQEDEIDTVIRTLPKLHKKILIAPEDYPINAHGYHDERFVFVLSKRAAKLLVSKHDMHLFGTSWKSADFQPGKHERPIHDIIFSNGLILENLNLQNVPSGNYFLNAFPIITHGSSETLVTPILYTPEEIMRLNI